MSIRNLDKIFKPQSIAVVGATDTPRSVGSTVFRNLLADGFGGVVYPVNPRRESVHGVQAYPDVRSLPKTPDLAVLCTPATTIPDILQQCGEAGILGVLVLSAGFRETGEAGKKLEESVLETARRFEGMRLLGPNCLGVMVPALRLNASFAAAAPGAGHVAFVSQSGALCTSVLDWAMGEGIGFSHFISIGNMVDVDFGDIIDYLGQDPHTQSIILYIESITDARKFMSASRAFARTKPIVAYKAGRFATSARAAASHTGAMAGEDAVYDAAFQRAEIVRVHEIDEIFGCAELLARHRLPKGPRLAIITNAGGPGVMATDSLLSRQGTPANLSTETLDALDKVLPPFWSRGNPVDVLGDATPDRFRQAVEIALEDAAVDAVLVILTPQAMTDPTAVAQELIPLASRSLKPMLAAWIGGESVRAGADHFMRDSVPTYTTPEKAVRAFTQMVSYSRNLEILHETPRDIPVHFDLDRKRIQEIFELIFLEGEETIPETLSKALLDAYGIPVAKAYVARSPEEAVGLARRIGYPVAVKIHSRDITHKSDVEGVALYLVEDIQVREAYQRMMAATSGKFPQARLDGVSVQKMITRQDGLEVIIGAKQDSTFGAVIMVGMGGVTAELLGDRALGLPPLNERLARRMIESLRSWPLFSGYRGKSAVHLDLLIEILIRFSYLISDYPQIREFDMNPLLVTPRDGVVLDARAVVDRRLPASAIRPFTHLAIRPYPEQYIRSQRLKDGTSVVLRPIRPEDEPAWHRMLATCSPDSLHSRFRYSFKRTTHEMATRYCFIDYEREMAIVAEKEGEQDHEILGVGRLAADPNHDTAEYAVLVADPWQGKGLGMILTQYCLEIARSWGIKRIVAETAPDNFRMLATFRELGFDFKEGETEGVVFVDKRLET